MDDVASKNQPQSLIFTKIRSNKKLYVFNKLWGFTTSKNLEYNTTQIGAKIKYSHLIQRSPLFFQKLFIWIIIVDIYLIEM